MTLSQLADLGEFIGGIAVLATLIYLALQLRQNTKQLEQNGVAARLTAYHQANEQSWLAVLAIAQDSELSDIVARGLADPASLDAKGTDALQPGEWTAPVRRREYPCAVRARPDR
jgi:hypothetical protein